MKYCEMMVEMCLEANKSTRCNLVAIVIWIESLWRLVKTRC